MRAISRNGWAALRAMRARRRAGKLKKSLLSAMLQASSPDAPDTLDLSIHAEICWAAFPMQYPGFSAAGHRDFETSVRQPLYRDWILSVAYPNNQETFYPDAVIANPCVIQTRRELAYLGTSSSIIETSNDNLFHFLPRRSLTSQSIGFKHGRYLVVEPGTLTQCDPQRFVLSFSVPSARIT